MENILGYRKLIITVLVMGIATITLLTGAIDQETFKWLMGASGIAFLTANTVSKFSNNNKI